MYWILISLENITLFKTKFGDLMGGPFSGLFLCADHENQSHFAS